MKHLFKTNRIALTCISICCISLAFGQKNTTQIQAGIVDSNAKPEVFAPGIISTPFTEWSTSFTPDGKTVYSSLGAVYWTIVYAKLENNSWQKPRVVSFSGRFNDTDPFITPDGKRIFFISNRPFLSNASPDVAQKVVHIWYADYIDGVKWGTPHHLDSAINLNNVNNFAPSVSLDGTLYYCSRRDGLNGMQSFYTKWLGDHYDKPKQLLINGADEIQDPFIDPRERYVIFLNGNDLFISYRKGGEWTPAQNLGPVVNNGSSLSSPCVSKDGKMLITLPTG